MTEHTHYFTWIDYTIVGIIFVSLLTGAMRGLVRESLALITWILAFVIAILFSDKVSLLFTNHIDSPKIVICLSFILLLVVVLMIGATINKLLSNWIAKSSLSWMNRLLGLLFGVLRGFMIVIGLVLLIKLTYLVHTGAWQHSMLLPYVQPLVKGISVLLPADIANYFTSVY